MVEPLKSTEVSRPISDRARFVIAELVLAWARLDATVTQLTIYAFGPPFDEGSILIGSMDTRTKLDRLKALYQHYDMPDAVESIANLAACHRYFVKCRNAVAHSVCIGHFLPQPNLLVFSAGRHSKGNTGWMSVEMFATELLQDAASFAQEAAELIASDLEQRPMPPSKRPLEPPLFRALADPSPHRTPDHTR